MSQGPIDEQQVAKMRQFVGTFYSMAPALGRPPLQTSSPLSSGSAREEQPFCSTAPTK